MCSCGNTTTKDKEVDVKDIATPDKGVNSEIEDYFGKTLFKIESSFVVSGDSLEVKLSEKGKGTFNYGALQAYSLLMIYEFYDQLQIDKYEFVLVSITNNIEKEEALKLSYTKSQLKNNIEQHKSNQTYVKNVKYCLNNFNDSTYFEFDVILKKSLPEIFNGFNTEGYGFMDILPMYSNECKSGSVSNGVISMRALAFHFYMTAQENSADYANNNLENKIEYLNYFLSNCDLGIIDLKKKVSYDNEKGILVDGQAW